MEPEIRENAGGAGTENLPDAGARDQKTGRFRKGKSGNPGGRKRMPKDTKAALEKLTPAAVRRLQEILEDDKAGASAHIKAAALVLDRVYGKPATEAAEDKGGQAIIARMEGAGPEEWNG